jgi:hypothetical protein
LPLRFARGPWKIGSVTNLQMEWLLMNLTMDGQQQQFSFSMEQLHQIVTSAIKKQTVNLEVQLKEAQQKCKDCG